MAENKRKKPVFQSLRAVVQHLEAAGFKISTSKISRDKKKNLIQVNGNGTVDEAEVRAYAATLERREGSVGDLSDLHAQKTAREVESLELKVKKQRFELDKERGKYLPRTDVVAELVARAVILDTGLKHYFNSSVGELIALVGGRPEKAPDLLQALTAGLEERLREFTEPDTFQVLFEEQRP